MAKAAILAVLLACTPLAGTLHGQTKPATAAPAAENKLDVLFKRAGKEMEAKKYQAAYDTLTELEKLLGAEGSEMLKAVLDFNKAVAAYSLKDWAKTETELTAFLAKHPKGTDDFYGTDNKRGIAQLTLVEAYASQSKWDPALALLEKLRAPNLSIRAEDRISAYTLSARIIEEKAKSAGAEDKKKALGQAMQLLKSAIAEGLGTPERREAAAKLVEVYTKLGLTKEAEQLKAEVDARGTGSPADIVRSNFQRIEIGDSRFEAAENAPEEKEKFELYRQALASYQGTLRRATVARSVTRAVEAKQAEVDNLVKLYPKPDDNAKIKIEEARAGVEQFKKIEADFAANKDYDAFISYRIGLCLLELNKHWEAFVAFRDIFDNNPGFTKVSGAYYYYILALRQIGRNTEAQAKCKEFLQKYPDADEVSAVAVILGEISQDREEYKEAIEHYNWAKANVKKIDPSTVEEIDFRIICCLFANVDWDQAGAALDTFNQKYPRSLAREQSAYMRALCWFYQGKYKETKAGFDQYLVDFAGKGKFLADVRYRQAIVKFGLQPPETVETLRLCNEWLKDYAVNKDENVVNQVPEVHTLIGDAEMRLATELDKSIRQADESARTNPAPETKKKFLAEKAAFEKEKDSHTAKAIDAYVAAARSGRTNTNALEFVLRELGKLLPGRGEHARMRDLYKEVYDWDHNDPKALTYLYEVIKATERLGDKPEFAQRSEEVQKRFSGQLAAERKKVDALERQDGSTKEAIAAAKAEVTKLSAKLAEELAVVDKDRQASILAAKTEALALLSSAVAESINDRKQEGNEKLVIFLCEKLARKVKRVKPGTPVDPAAYSPANAEAELTQLLRLAENKDSLIAQARGFFAMGQLNVFLRNPERADTFFKKVSANYKAEELSPTILAVVGDHLLSKGEAPKAAAYFEYIKEHNRSSEYADFGFAGLAEILLQQKKFKEALELCNEAVDNNITMSKEKEIKFARARALAELSRLDEAIKEFEDIMRTKEWRGEMTAAALFWLGQIHERNANQMAQGKPSLIKKPKDEVGPTGVPAAMAGTSPTSGAAPLTVKFMAPGPEEKPKGKVTYHWDFGDKLPTSHEAKPTHTYATAGEFTATLTVKVDNKEESKTTVTINALVNHEPADATDGFKKSVAYYRRCYQTWKKYESWSAKAYLGTARMLSDKLGQKPEAKLVLAEMLSKDRIKDTPEAAEAKSLNTRL